MKSKKLLNEVLKSVELNEIKDLEGGKWPVWQCLSVALTCAAGPICGGYSYEVCKPGGLYDQNCR